MRTEITTGPITRTPIGMPTKVEFDLGLEDFVAWWTFLACNARKHLPLRVQERMLNPVRGILVGITLTLFALGFIFSEVSVKQGWHVGFGVTFLVFSLAALYCCPMIGGILLEARPDLCLKGPLAKLYRRPCLLGLRRLAQSKICYCLAPRSAAGRSLLRNWRS